MKQVKISQLAKDLGVSNGELIVALKDLGAEVDTENQTVDTTAAELVREYIQEKKEAEAAGKVVEMGSSISVRDLAEAMGIQPGDLQKRLVEQGILATLNHQLTFDDASHLAQRYGYTVKKGKPSETKSEKPASIQPQPKTKRSGKAVPRPPVVTIMGHVDHGKTTLLDSIRKTNVTAQEFGGITQHIGAYQVEINGRKITFLDTPGHAAFTAMRARGAGITDIAVLVVAADDSVMPQTVEAIDHAKAAGVPIIVAINKIDKPEANVERTKQQLTEYDLVPEEWGGDTVMCEVSAKTGEGIPHLLEMILLVADLADLQAEASGTVHGAIVEAKLDKGRGPVATVLIQQGTLKVGVPVVAGQSYGKVKAMFDENGQRVTKAGPSTPVEILGLSSVPMAGDILVSAKSEKDAKQIAERRMQASRSERMERIQRVTLQDLYRQIQEGAVKELNVILKGDVQGSVEAVRHSLEQLGTDEVRVKIIHTGVGNISESDIILASASNAVVIGFNVKSDAAAGRAAEQENVDVRHYNIIYELINDVKGALAGLLEPVIEEEYLGRAEVRAVFNLSKAGTIAGCYVLDGKVVRNAMMRILRNDEVIYKGKLDSLKHFKEDVREMAAGFECGIATSGFGDYEVGDIVEVYNEKEVARALK